MAGNPKEPFSYGATRVIFQIERDQESPLCHDTHDELDRLQTTAFLDRRKNGSRMSQLPERYDHLVARPL
jgi:hypothetical protein